jgi:two-component system, NtrC family, response regulator AtoC
VTPPRPPRQGEASRLPLALIVDDDQEFAHSLELLVKREQFETRTAASLGEARKAIAAERPDVILLDMGLPDGDGMEFVRSENASIGAEVIVITGQASVDSAVEALREGVLDYLVKPVDRARLKATLAHVARTRALKTEVHDLRGELRDLGRFGPMVGRSKAMQAVYDLIERVAPTDAHVFITGESGTGKELVAQTIHQLSVRRDGPMLPINCGAVSPQLIESELFGHERGSFTGADKQHKGYFERARGGTVLLDEITEMPIELQVKLLRVLEAGVVMRVGGTEPIPIDARVIAASNRDPAEAVKQGKMREDLFYRLNVFPIPLPPLRDREDDVDLLAEYFLEQLNASSGQKKKAWTRAAIERLRAQRMPGNVRELRNLVQRAFILAEEEIGRDSVPVEDGLIETGPTAHLQVHMGSSIAETEQRLILATLEHFGGDKEKAARTLGISLKTLYNRLNVYSASRAGAEARES